ncbi:hypothetical protein ACERII_12125 [Evansella sp. AB-rgal1]
MELRLTKLLKLDSLKSLTNAYFSDKMKEKEVIGEDRHERRKTNTSRAI